MLNMDSNIYHFGLMLCSLVCTLALSDVFRMCICLSQFPALDLGCKLEKNSWQILIKLIVFIELRFTICSHIYAFVLNCQRYILIPSFNLSQISKNWNTSHRSTDYGGLSQDKKSLLLLTKVHMIRISRTFIRTWTWLYFKKIH